MDPIDKKHRRQALWEKWERLGQLNELARFVKMGKGIIQNEIPPETEGGPSAKEQSAILVEWVDDIVIQLAAVEKEFKSVSLGTLVKETALFVKDGGLNP
jgi:hypothetical protein